VIQWKHDVVIVATGVVLTGYFLLRDWLLTRKFRREWDKEGKKE
jgi:hypothetical protein